jgi:hypothetical protein
MRRLKQGEFFTMTHEQQKAHKRMLQKRWRARNKDRVKEMNHKWAVYYWATKPFLCICQKCGKEFGAARRYFITCPDCIQAHIAKNKAKRDLAIMKAKEKVKRNKNIIRLHQKGLLQKEIEQRTGVKQGTISYILRTNGYRTQDYRRRK